MKKNWETCLTKAAGFARQGAGCLYDRVLWLSKAYDDPEYKTDMETQGRSPNLEMNELVRDTFTNFAELYAMIRLFPRRGQWSGGDLPAMREQMRDTLRSREKRVSDGAAADRSPDGRSSRSRVLSWKQKYLELEEKYKTLLERSKQQEKEIGHLRELLRPAKRTAS